MTRPWVVVPWRDAPELAAPFAAMTRHCDGVVVLDPDTPRSVVEPITIRLGWSVIEQARPFCYAACCNLGIQAAPKGDPVVIVMNNDVSGDAGILRSAEGLVEPGRVYGPCLAAQTVLGVHIPYIEGWCIAARRSTWADLGGFDEDYAGAFYEDTDIGLKCAMKGIELVQAPWPLVHERGHTAARVLGSYAKAAENERRWRLKAAAWIESL